MSRAREKASGKSYRKIRLWRHGSPQSKGRRKRIVSLQMVLDFSSEGDIIAEPRVSAEREPDRRDK